MKSKDKNVRVRFAPSPTGPLHIGGSRTALFNYIFAKQNKGKFVLRIEDTDLERSEQKWTDEIIKELKWLGVAWDEGPDVGGDYGPYKQSQRLDIYKNYLEKLFLQNKAYYCFCAAEELEAKRQEQMARGTAPKYDGKCAHLPAEAVQKNLAEGKPSVIRFRIPDKKVKFKDLVRGEVEFDAGLLGDIVIAKNLNAPLYHFAVVVDDYEMQISHVIRGEEHLSNTPRQILIQQALDFSQPVYAHLPLMLNTDRSKLSKRQGDVALSDYHNQGYLPEAIVNFMALLGWNPGTEKEMFSLPQLIKEFSIEKVQKAGAVFNIQRLDFINGVYIREKPIEKITELCLPYLVESNLLVKMGDSYEIAGIREQIPSKTLQKIIEICRSRLKKLAEIPELSEYFFKENLSYDKNLLKWQKMGDEGVKEALSYAEEALSAINAPVDKWNLKNLEKVLLPLAQKFNAEKGYPEQNRGYLLWPLRVALSGRQASASPFEIADILGKEKTLKRISKAINILA